MNDKQLQLLEAARSLIGTPYKYAVPIEEIPKAIDCSSFTQYIYKQMGINLERSTILQATQGKNIEPTTNGQQLTPDLQIGDLLFFRGSKGHYDDKLFPNKEIYIGHVVMYVGENKAIHAALEKGVVEEDINNIIRERGAIVVIKRIL